MPYRNRVCANNWIIFFHDHLAVGLFEAGMLEMQDALFHKPHLGSQPCSQNAYIVHLSAYARRSCREGRLYKRHSL